MAENGRREAVLAEALVQGSVDGLLATDREQRYTLWNRAMERFSGKKAEEVLGRRALEVFPFLKEVGLDVALTRALAGETVHVAAVAQPTPEGSTAYFDRYYSPLHDEGGTVIGAVGIVRDVTARCLAEAAFQEREELFRSVVESSSDSIAIVDAGGVPLYLNPALLRTLGWSSDALASRTMLDLAHPDDRPRAEAVLARSVAEIGATIPLETRGRHGDGSWRVLDGHARSFRNRHGQINVVVDARDVTTERETAERLRAANKMEAIGRLAGGVAHDFNNLLTVILGCADLLARSSPPASAMARHVEDMRQAAERGASLTRQLLTFSRKQPVQAKVIDLDALVGDLETMLRRLLGERIELTRDLAAGPRGRVRADEGQIEQVVLNLVINARDAVGEGGGRIGIATAIAHVDDGASGVAPGEYVRLRVTDDGCGMTDDVKAHLFEPFFTTKPRGQGTGLGLATVYGVVKQCGGAVTATSAPDRGATFEVLLPVVADAAERAPAQLPAPPRGSETVLLVEDEAPLRRLIREVLTESGYEVVEAADGEEALRVCSERAARQERVDLVLSDVVMPGMGGRQLAQKVRRTWPGARVLLMSGYDDDVVAGPDDMVLGKPFTAAVLAARVREALDGRAHGGA